LLAKLRPWRLLAGVLGGLAAFGVLVNAVARAAWPRGVHGPLAVGADSFTQHGVIVGILHHWLLLPKNTYEIANYRIGNYAFVVLIAVLLILTLLHGW